MGKLQVLGAKMIGCTQSPPPTDLSITTARSHAWKQALNTKVSGDVAYNVGTYTLTAGDTGQIVILHEVDDAEHWLAAWRGENNRRQMFQDNGCGGQLHKDY